MDFQFKHFEVNHILEMFAISFQSKASDNKVEYSKEFGKGYIKALRLPSGINYFIFEYDYLEKFLMQHFASEKENYLVWFDISTNTRPSTFLIDKTLKKNNEIHKLNAIILCSKIDFSLVRPINNKGYGIGVLLHKKILTSFLGNTKWGNCLDWYYDFKINNLDNIKITDAENELILDVINGTKKGNNLINLEKRIYQLLELFFIRVFNLYENIGQKKKLTAKEGEILAYFEKLIGKKNISNEIDYKKMELEIGINKKEIASLILKVFNKTLISFIKESRLKIAYNDVINAIKSISDIAYEFGYANPSNFSIAFKAQFGKNPNDFR